jgi:predicted DNA-binding protein
MMEFDPNLFPRRLELKLPAEMVQRLQRRADRSGRCLAEVLVELLSAQLDPPEGSAEHR